MHEGNTGRRADMSRWVPGQAATGPAPDVTPGIVNPTANAHAEHYPQFRQLAESPVAEWKPPPDRRRETTTPHSAHEDAADRPHVMVVGGDEKKVAHFLTDVVVGDVVGDNPKFLWVADFTNHPRLSGPALKRAEELGVIHSQGNISATRLVEAIEDPQIAAEVVVNSVSGALNGVEQADQKRSATADITKIFMALGENSVPHLKAGLRELIDQSNPSRPAGQRNQSPQPDPSDEPDILTPAQKRRLNEIHGKNMSQTRVATLSELYAQVRLLLLNDAREEVTYFVPKGARDGDAIGIHTDSIPADFVDDSVRTRLLQQKIRLVLKGGEKFGDLPDKLVLVIRQMPRSELDEIRKLCRAGQIDLVEVHREIPDDPQQVPQIGGAGSYLVNLNLTPEQAKMLSEKLGTLDGQDQPKNAVTEQVLSEELGGNTFMGIDGRRKVIRANIAAVRGAPGYHDPHTLVYDPSGGGVVGIRESTTSGRGIFARAALKASSALQRRRPWVEIAGNTEEPQRTIVASTNQETGQDPEPQPHQVLVGHVRRELPPGDSPHIIRRELTNGTPPNSEG